MSFNGSGTFVRLYDWTTDSGNGVKILASRMDDEMDGMATGLSTCITKDGQTTVTANLPMATFRHTGVGAASARTDYARASQVQDDSFVYGAAGGTADAITITLSPAITAYAAGLRVKTFAGGANTGAVTLNVNGVGAVAVKKRGGTALAANDIPGAGYPLHFEHDGTDWELVNLYDTVNNTGTQTVAGDKTFSGATTFSGDVTFSAGVTDPIRVDVADGATVNLTPATINSRYARLITSTTAITAITLPDGNACNVLFNTARTLTNGASLILPGGANITTAAGDTATFIGEASGVVRCVDYVRAAVKPSTAFSNFFESAEQTITTATRTAVAHGLGVVPTLFTAVLRCKTAELGHAVGDELVLNVPYYNDSIGEFEYGIQASANSTNCIFVVGENAVKVYQGATAIGQQSSITTANWRVVLRAWAA